jgi:small subunit ribosomal protein S25
MQQKWSTAILKELMDLAGGVSWGQWKSHAQASGQPIVPGEEKEARAGKASSIDGAVLPTLKAFRAAETLGSATEQKIKTSPSLSSAKPKKVTAS